MAGQPGAPAGQPLLGSNNAPSPRKHRPTLDLQADHGFRVSVGPTTGTANDVYLSRVSYVTGASVAPGTDTYIGAGTKAGGVLASRSAADKALGQRVRTVTARQAGRQKLVLDQLPTGIYLLKLQVGELATSRQLVVE